MIYIIFTMAIIINVFNILVIANNNIEQNIKEKTLLVTYSTAELIYIIFILSLIEYTAASTVFVISFISVWLLAKSYICVINMNFKDNGDEIIRMDNKNELNEISYKQEFIENTVEDNLEEVGAVLEVADNEVENVEVIHEVPADKVVHEVSENNVEDIDVVEVVDEKIELSDLFEDSQVNVETPAALYDLDNIVESAKINKEEERRIRRRSLALRVSKMINNKE